jgi:hypothetical protein
MRQADPLVEKYGARSSATPYRVGETIRFGRHGNAGSYEREGWSVPEDGYTWSLGGKSILVLPLDADPRASMNLTLRGFPLLLAGTLTSQRVRIAVNGQAVAEWLLSENGAQQLTVGIPDKALVGSRSIEISLEMPDARSPKEIGYNGDVRILAVAFMDLRLHE